LDLLSKFGKSGVKIERNDPSLKYRIYVSFSVDNFIKFSTHIN